MPAISETLKLVDQFSGTYQSFLSYTERSAAAAESLDKKLDSLMSQSGTQLVSAAQRTNALLEEQLQTVKQITSSQNQQTNAVNRTQSAASSLLSTVGRIAALFGGAQILGAAVRYSDSMSTATARLNLMNDGLQTTAQLQEMIYQSAQRSRAPYLDTISIVSRLGQNARDAFSSNQETIQFAETLSKMFKIAGSSQEEMASASLQLTQALSSGVLRGEELNAVFEAAPNVIQEIADYLGVPIGQIRDMASEGQISAEVVKNALLSAADDVNRELESIPRTFSDAWTEIGNDALVGLQPLFDALQDFVNSDMGQGAIEALAVGFFALGNAAAGAVNGIVSLLSFLGQNLNLIIGVLAGVAVAFFLMKFQAIAAGIASIASAAASAVAWLAANWPLLLIVAAVAGMIVMFSQAGVSVQDLGGIIGGVFGTIYAVIYNVIATVWNIIAAFAEFFANVFNNPLRAVAQLFSSVFDAILGIVETVAGAIDSLLGTNMAGAVSGFRSSMQSWVDEKFGKNEIQIDRMEQLDVAATSAEWAAQGRNLGSQIQGLGDQLGGLSDMLGSGPQSITMPGTSASSLGDLDIGSVGTVDNVKNVDGEVSLSDESLEIYRDLAQRRYMAQVELQTLAPEITVNLPAGAKNITAQDVADKLKAMLIQQMSSHTATAH